MIHEASPLLVLSIVLSAGVAGGGLVRRLGLPAVTGQILMGIVLGPSVLGLFETEAVHGLQPITHFALGLIAVKVGSYLNLHRLRNAGKRLLFLVLLESTLTPLLVFVAVRMVSRRPDSAVMAYLLAALAISTAPATIVAIVKEQRARGVFVKTLVAAVALNNLTCICLFEVAHTAARMRLIAGDTTALDIVVAPLVELLTSLAVGCGAGAALVLATRRVVNPDRLATSSMVAILLAVGLADWFEASSLLSCLFLGVSLANLTPERDELGHGVFANFESAIFAVFFTLAGLELDFQYALSAGGIAACVLIARLTGKVTSGHLAMRLAGATDRVRRWLGFALVPQAGVAVGLILILGEDPAFAPVYNLFLAVGLTVVTANEIIGPLLTRLALVRSGESGQDRARLIDFLHEENIVVGLTAETKEDAIAQLTRVLVRSNHLSADADALLESILERERQVSTCIGGGLAVPHGVLERGETMAGAMGISREGLDFETPDGLRVHCMVVLATPPGQRERHLEVLAALARAIGTDPIIQRQLFNAESPAHAYEILHAEESEDFNYFLED